MAANAKAIVNTPLLQGLKQVSDSPTCLQPLLIDQWNMLPCSWCARCTRTALACPASARPERCSHSNSIPRWRCCTIRPNGSTWSACCRHAPCPSPSQSQPIRLAGSHRRPLARRAATLWHAPRTTWCPSIWIHVFAASAASPSCDSSRATSGPLSEICARLWKSLETANSAPRGSTS